jgi:hypothetical protein
MISSEMVLKKDITTGMNIDDIQTHARISLRFLLESLYPSKTNMNTAITAKNNT